VRFEAVTYQNEYLPPGGTNVDAIVTVTAHADGGDRPATPAPSAVVLILDVSGSMSPRPKLRALRRAAATAIAQLRDGVAFAVIAGNHEAHITYPGTATLAIASDATRATAIDVVQQVRAFGGTAIGRWLTLARDLLASAGHQVRRAILLTDGEDSDETPADLRAAIDSCIGVFQCDCRGVGTAWRVDELRAISMALLGSVDIVAEPEGMAADFDALMRGAMATRAGDVRLRLWVPRDGVVRFVKQVAPTIEQLTSVPCDARTVEVAIGSWGEESRDYHVAITVAAQQLGDEMLAGRISLLVDGDVVSTSMVRATWTDDAETSALIDPRVAHYTGQAELAAAIADGLQARAGGDEATATVHLGRAAQIAATSGNDATLRLLANVVELHDVASGTVRLRPHVDRADEMALDVRSTRTVRITNEP